MNALLALAASAPAASLLLAVTLLVSLFGLFRSPAIIARNLFRPHWLLSARQYATLVTSAFIHADLAHLVFNAFTFWAFAFALEQRIGSVRFLALYAFGLLASDAGTWLKHHREPEYATLGASGAILAVLFASVVYFPGHSILILPIPVPIPSLVFAVGYLAYTWIASRKGLGRVNHDAHFSGAIAGVVFVALTDAPAFANLLQYLQGHLHLIG